MRITFVVPDFVSVPVGGIKVAYELANGLADGGHSVTILHFDTLRSASGALRLRRDARFALWRRGLSGWFRLRAGVTAGLIDPERPDLLPESDHVVAVGWKTVSLVASASDRAGRRSYLAQGYMAAYEGAPDEVDAAWRLPIHKIVISGWLAAKARELCGEDIGVSRIHIAVGPEFIASVNPEARSSTSVATYYHRAPYKGFAEAKEALSMLLPSHPIQATAFGAERPDVRLPGWMTFAYRPRHVASIYNSAAIFVHASSLEGFPLPPAEAMASGCALAAFANEGVSDYAVDGHNALLVPVGDVAGLAAAVGALVEDRDLRIRLARQSINDMAGFTWRRSVDEFEAALSEIT